MPAQQYTDCRTSANGAAFAVEQDFARATGFVNRETQGDGHVGTGLFLGVFKHFAQQP